MTEYICKCGKRFKKSTDAGTTGYRMPDYGPTHECYGCHFVVPLHKGLPDSKVVNHECRASKKINYKTGCRICTAPKDFSLAHIYTLDIDFITTAIKYYNSLEGKESEKKVTFEFRAAISMDDGRMDFAFPFQKNRKGSLSKAEFAGRFFDGGSFADAARNRLDLTVDEEHAVIIDQIKRSQAAVRPKKEPNEIFMLRARKCARCGGILTSAQAVEEGMGHVCKMKANGEYGIEKPLDGQICLFSGAENELIDGGKSQ